MRNKLISFFNKAWAVDLLLFLVSFCIYFYYFTDVFLNFNSALSSVTGDSLKNYYTYVYHIKNDPGFLHFNGMNYPYGEHVIYTDSHPGLTFILQYLPFTHNYLIGIMHFLIFLSYLIAPSITNRVFMRLGFSRTAGFFISIGLTLLAPQFFRVYAGHFSMAYAVVIPLSALLVLDYFRLRSAKAVFFIFLYILILFFIHPYLAFEVSVFLLLCMAFFEMTDLKRQRALRTGLDIFIATLLPMLLFKLFMLVTDHHPQRPTLPHGFESSVCTFGSLLVPLSGPFEHFLSTLLNTKPAEFEGYCYLGFAFICLTIAFIFLLPFFYKKMRFKKETVALLAASFVLLLFSFGVHLKYVSMTNETLNQFRALGRFSWFFYYMLPVFVFTALYYFLKNVLPEQKVSWVFGGITILYLVLNTVEAGALFDLYGNYFHDRNFFSANYLNKEEKALIEKLQHDKPQAIIPLPTYNIGSEIYDRITGPNLASPLLSSTLYSYHTGLPIVSAMLSRNSIPETEEVINLLNTYKKDRSAITLLNGQPFAVITTKAPRLPDEDRLLQGATPFLKSDSLEFSYLSEKTLLTPILDQKTVSIHEQHPAIDSNGVVFIKQMNRTPFILSNSPNYESLFHLDSNSFKTGRYIVSLHFHYKNGSWRDLLCHFLLTKNKAGASEWKDFITMRLQSGFYKGYAVFEYYVDLEAENSYEFLMRNDETIPYRVSDVMLRPVGTTVITENEKRERVYNNFPPY